ncbi:hypothetical protein [Dethiobacter alkaliphilus]|uniref:Uncharacterized protein n=1 Tax=Dethiobacter alkaliphilus AHT 1 TaxID=555088 RepID=C0GFE0_DETAL|nr:hypothetical protein [Dethiobacter alkaliphilus]EEG77900.1 hypothetical protein DealDRAFT_1199 [Dethiobacter alkaliphilus AHT 1]
MKIKDRLLLGAISGSAASFAARLLNRYNYAKGYTDIRYNPLAARLFLKEGEIKSTPGIILGEIVNSANTSATGVLLTYLLSATGKDKAVFKGMAVGTFFWIIVDGVMSGYVFNVKSKKPIGPLAHLAEHLLYGVLCSTFITQLGDESLFPSDTTKQTPLIHTGVRSRRRNAARPAPTSQRHRPHSKSNKHSRGFQNHSSPPPK